MPKSIREKIASEYLLVGLTKLRPFVTGDELRILIQPDQGEPAKKIWLRLMKSGNSQILEAVADLFTGMGIDPDELGRLT